MMGLDDRFVVGAGGMQNPGESDSVSVSFDTWRQPSTDRPTLVLIEAAGTTPGTSGNSAQVDLSVDESGGTTPDYTATVVYASYHHNGGERIHESLSFILPAGGQYQIKNVEDPNGTNTINVNREWKL